MKNPVEKYYGAILEDGRRCVEKINGELIEFKPNKRAKAEKKIITESLFDGIFAGDDKKAKERNPFDDIFQ